MEGGKKLLIGTNYGTLQVHDACNAYEPVEEYGGQLDAAERSLTIYRLQASITGFCFIHILSRYLVEIRWQALCVALLRVRSEIKVEIKDQMA